MNVEGEHEHAARPAPQGDLCTSDGEVRSGQNNKRLLKEADAVEPDSKRQRVTASSPVR